MKINTITPDSHPFLTPLTALAKVPSRIYYRGKLPETRVPSIVIVGARKPTRYGQEVTVKFATELTQKGIVIISGLALGTDVLALQQDKDVFVVPGNITSPMSAGCNNLLKQGARVATCSDDVLEIIAPDLLHPQTALPLGSTHLETKILNLIQSGNRDDDAIHQQADVPIAEFNHALTMLELAGSIRAPGANQWTIK